MKGKSLLIGSAALILACGPVSQPFAQTDGLDVTLRVLDDLSDIDGVILSIDREPRDEESDRQPADGGAPEAATVESAFAEASGDELGLESELDREEDSEGEIEDFDVPEDIELPEEVEE
jgi:hypothetical protein